MSHRSNSIGNSYIQWTKCSLKSPNKIKKHTEGEGEALTIRWMFSFQVENWPINPLNIGWQQAATRGKLMNMGRGQYLESDFYSLGTSCVLWLRLCPVLSDDQEEPQSKTVSGVLKSCPPIRRFSYVSCINWFSETFYMNLWPMSYHIGKINVKHENINHSESNRWVQQLKQWTI